MERTLSLRICRSALLTMASLFALTPTTAEAQTGILHKQTYAPVAQLAATASSLHTTAGSVSSLPATADPHALPPRGLRAGGADAASGIMLESVGTIEGVPRFSGPATVGVDGGKSVSVPPVLDGGEVHILPYPGDPAVLPPIATKPGVDIGLPATPGRMPGGAFTPPRGARPGGMPPHGHRLGNGDGGLAVALPPGRDFGEGVHVMPLSWTPEGAAVATAAAVVEMTPAARPGGRLLSPAPTNRLHQHAVGVGIGVGPQATPTTKAPSPPAPAAARSSPMAKVPNVAVERAAAPLRWVDRLRFAWPGSNK